MRVARPVIFEIQGDFVGYNIKKFSRFQEEDEVLLEPETMFRIVSIEKDKRNESVTRIVVAVQKSPLLINEAVENFRKAEQEYKIKQMRQQQQQQPLTTSDNTQTGSANQPTLYKNGGANQPGSTMATTTTTTTATSLNE